MSVSDWRRGPGKLFHNLGLKRKRALENRASALVSKNRYFFKARFLSSFVIFTEKYWTLHYVNGSINITQLFTMSSASTLHSVARTFDGFWRPVWLSVPVSTSATDCPARQYLSLFCRWSVRCLGVPLNSTQSPTVDVVLKEWSQAK